MILTNTERLVIRDLVPEDATNILLLNNDREVLRHVGDKPFADLASAKVWIADHRVGLPHGFGRWSIELADGTWIGRCSLRRDEGGETQMGYRLLRSHWGKGYGTELVRALSTVGFERFEARYILVKIARANAASVRVAEKCGARFWKEGLCERFSDALIYRIDRAKG